VYKTGIDFDEVTDIDLDIQQSKHMKPTKRTAETDTDSFKLMQNKKIKQQKIDAILLDLIQQDKKIEAIKRARELYGYGLVEAKDYVEHLEQNSDSSNPMQYKKVNRQKIDAILLDLIQQGKKIEAIKRARELYDYGLAEAKDYVEHLEQKSDSI
jgi:ribosomal protein L7/L12